MIPYEELAAALSSQSPPVRTPPAAPPPRAVVDRHHGHASGLDSQASIPALDDPTLNSTAEDPSAELDIGEVLADDFED